MKLPLGVCAVALAASSRLVHNVLAASVAGSGSASAAGSSSSSYGLPDDRPQFIWWEMVTSGSHGGARALVDPRWWWHYIVSEFAAEPAHAIVETICIVTILYLVFLRKPAPMGVQEKLTKKEEDEIIAEWKPMPLCPKAADADDETKPKKERFIVESATDRTVRANGQTYLNFACNNFLGLAGKPETNVACRETIEKYGVGSCGPRGFYGTFDVHLEIEREMAKFLQAEECILYSDALACVSSVIPAFGKKGDTIVVDEAVSFGIQQGCLLSRSTVHYYKHNDMGDLERVLESLAKQESSSKAKQAAAKLHRKFIVCEGVSSIYGDIAPLAKLVELKHRYAYRILVDDSLGFGVLGATGRGSLEHAGLAMQGTLPAEDGRPGVDIVCVAMDGTLASVGGICVGSHAVVDHQRLSGAGYCFSASSPPYTSTASLVALNALATQPQLVSQLRKRAHKLRRALATVAAKNLVVLGGPESDDSPVIHLAVKGSKAESRDADATALERLSDLLRTEGKIIATVPEFIPTDRLAAKVTPTLRVVVSAAHTEADLDKLVKVVGQAATKAFAAR